MLSHMCICDDTISAQVHINLHFPYLYDYKCDDEVDIPALSPTSGGVTILSAVTLPLICFFKFSLTHYEISNLIICTHI